RRSRGKRLDAVCLQLAGEFVVHRQVQLPQLLPAPGRHRIRVDRADVGVREECQGLQSLDGTYLVRHIAYGLRVGNVPRLHRSRKVRCRRVRKRTVSRSAAGIPMRTMAPLASRSDASTWPSPGVPFPESWNNSANVRTEGWRTSAN